VTEIFLDGFEQFVVRPSPVASAAACCGQSVAALAPPTTLPESRSKIITIGADLDVLLCEGPVNMLIFMRSGSMCQRRFADLIGAFWLELDARNVVSGTDVALIESSLPACYFHCNCWRSASETSNRRSRSRQQLE
jgi:hypothetical protein